MSLSAVALARCMGTAERCDEPNRAQSRRARLVHPWKGALVGRWRDAPADEIRERARNLPVFCRRDQHGRSEIVLDSVHVPATDLLAEEGYGFMIAQARGGPSRIHHAMRDRDGRTRQRVDGGASKDACGVRQAAGRPRRRWRPHRSVTDRDRASPPAHVQNRAAYRPTRRRGRTNRDRCHQSSPPRWPPH